MVFLDFVVELQTYWLNFQLFREILATDLLYMSWNQIHRKPLDLIGDSKQNVFHPHATLLSFIRKLSSFSWEVSFNHILREGNENVPIGWSNFVLLISTTLWRHGLLLCNRISSCLQIFSRSLGSWLTNLCSLIFLLIIKK
jgi:hypothetical protein